MKDARRVTNGRLQRGQYFTIPRIDLDLQCFGHVYEGMNGRNESFHTPRRVLLGHLGWTSGTVLVREESESSVSRLIFRGCVSVAVEC